LAWLIAQHQVAQKANEYFGGVAAGIATGLQLRHDHGSVCMSEHFQGEVQFLGIESSPAFVRQPEGLPRRFRKSHSVPESVTYATLDSTSAAASFTP
jgi:hypothetical protein